MKKAVFITALITFLSGCASAPETQKIETPNNTTTALSEAATSISHSLVQLSRIEEAAHPTANLSEAPNPDSYGMGAISSVDWSGQIEPLLKQLAQVTSYRVRVLGNAPAVPLLITLNEKNVPIADIVRDAAYQCGKRATVTIYPETKVIELRYAQN